MSQAAVAGTPPAVHGRARNNGQARQAGLTAKGLAVWVTVPV